jgi:hypothetical protein
MNIREACASIMGEKLALAIIADQGIHWAVVAAMAEATTDDDPAAIAAIDEWNALQKTAS